MTTSQRFTMILVWCSSLGVLGVWSGAMGSPDGLFELVHGPFTFRFTEADRPLVGALEGLADRSWDRLTTDLGIERAGPITVVLAPTDEVFNQRQPSGEPLPAWASGVAYPSLMTMVIRSYHVPGTPRQDVGTIFVHELSHLFLGARFGARPIPRWLNEGLAMYEAYEWEPGQEWTLVQAVIANRVPLLDDLTVRFERGEVEARLAYLLAGSLVNDMIATYGREAFADFVDRLAQGDSLNDAMVGAYQISPLLFERRWRAHLDRRYAWIPILTSSSAVWVIVMGLALTAYVARKRRNRRIRAEWATDEDRSPASPHD